MWPANDSFVKKALKNLYFRPAKDELVTEPCINGPHVVGTGTEPEQIAGAVSRSAPLVAAATAAAQETETETETAAAGGMPWGTSRKKQFANLEGGGTKNTEKRRRRGGDDDAGGVAGTSSFSRSVSGKHHAAANANASASANSRNNKAVLPTGNAAASAASSGSPPASRGLRGLAEQFLGRSTVTPGPPASASAPTGPAGGVASSSADRPPLLPPDSPSVSERQQSLQSLAQGSLHASQLSAGDLVGVAGMATMNINAGLTNNNSGTPTEQEAKSTKTSTVRSQNASQNASLSILGGSRRRHSTGSAGTGTVGSGSVEGPRNGLLAAVGEAERQRRRSLGNFQAETANSLPGASPFLDLQGAGAKSAVATGTHNTHSNTQWGGAGAAANQQISPNHHHNRSVNSLSSLVSGVQGLTTGNQAQPDRASDITVNTISEFLAAHSSTAAATNTASKQTENTIQSVVAANLRSQNGQSIGNAQGFNLNLAAGQLQASLAGAVAGRVGSHSHLHSDSLASQQSLPSMSQDTAGGGPSGYNSSGGAVTAPTGSTDTAVVEALRAFYPDVFNALTTTGSGDNSDQTPQAANTFSALSPTQQLHGANPPQSADAGVGSFSNAPNVQRPAQLLTALGVGPAAQTAPAAGAGNLAAANLNWNNAQTNPKTQSRSSVNTNSNTNTNTDSKGTSNPKKGKGKPEAKSHTASTFQPEDLPLVDSAGAMEHLAALKERAKQQSLDSTWSLKKATSSFAVATATGSAAAREQVSQLTVESQQINATGSLVGNAHGQPQQKQTSNAQAQAQTVPPQGQRLDPVLHGTP